MTSIFLDFGITLVLHSLVIIQVFGSLAHNKMKEREIFLKNEEGRCEVLCIWESEI